MSAISLSIHENNGVSTAAAAATSPTTTTTTNHNNNTILLLETILHQRTICHTTQQKTCILFRVAGRDVPRRLYDDYWREKKKETGMSTGYHFRSNKPLVIIKQCTTAQLHITKVHPALTCRTATTASIFGKFTLVYYCTTIIACSIHSNCKK